MDPYEQQRPTIGQAASQWFSDAAGSGIPAALMWGGGQFTKNIPGLKWVAPTGRFLTAFAPVTATQNTLFNAAGKNMDDVPSTAGGHVKKWLANAGSQAAIGVGMAGTGKLISMIPHPWARAAGLGLTAAGKLATQWAPIDASVMTGMDLAFGKSAPPPQARAQTDWSPYITTGIAGLAGLTGTNLLLSAIPGIKKSNGLKTLLNLAAMFGSGYLAWQYMQNRNNARA